MNEQEKLKAKIEQNETDQQKLKEEQERLQGELDKSQITYLDKSQITYSEGDRFKRGGEKYLLVFTGDGVALVGLGDGHYFRGCVNVDDFYAITTDEFYEIGGGNFRRYWDARKVKQC